MWNGSILSVCAIKALILAAYPFFPMGTVFVAPFLILSFKFEKQLLITFQVLLGAMPSASRRSYARK